MTPSDQCDPGWGKALRLTRPLGSARRSSRRAPDGITAARVVFLSFPAALILISVALLLIDPDFEVTTLPAVIVAAATATGLAGITIVNGRTLDCEDAATAYRTSMFLKTALAEVPVLAGFVLFFLDGTYLTFLLGVVISIPSFWLAAPRGADIDRRQQQLHDAGCMVDLWEALRLSAPHSN
ncbi:MAG: hypothetical protein HKN80_14140 [Acidimicrobiia bacterium]|nr:hypothetical protein [Acidimicrobiia bacterium]